jgi:uncharacterized membrane protein YwzB
MVRIVNTNVIANLEHVTEILAIVWEVRNVQQDGLGSHFVKKKPFVTQANMAIAVNVIVIANQEHAAENSVSVRLTTSAPRDGLDSHFAK